MLRIANKDETAILLEDSAESFLNGAFKPDRLRELYQGHHAYDRKFWQDLASQGWLSLRLPETAGGSGLSMDHVAVLAYRLGRFAVPDPYISCALMPATLFSTAFDTGNKRWAAIADGLSSGGYTVSPAWQENLYRFDVTPRVSHAKRHTCGYSLHGRKLGVVAGDWVDAFVVSACLDGEPALFLIDRNTPGVEVAAVLTSDGGSVATVALHDAVIEHDALLCKGPVSIAALALAMDEAVLAAAAQLLGLADRAFEITLDYMRTRVQFGRPIGSFQALQHVAVDVRMQLALASAACASAIRLYTTAPRADETRQSIAVAKARCSDAALFAGRFGVQAHGAVGFAAEADIGAYLKSAIRLAAFHGNGTQHRKRIATMATKQQQELV